MAIRFLNRLFTVENRHLALIAFSLFLMNQLLELSFLFAFKYQYSNLCGWDCIWYTGIVTHGYDLSPHVFANFPKGDVANWAFFPLLPMTAFVIKSSIGIVSSAYAVVITSKIFFALSIFAFIKFGLAYYPRLNPWVLGSIASFNPYVIYANAGYTESAFLLFTCLFFYFFKNKQFLIAGIMGGILSAVRLAGIFALFAIIPSWIELFQKANAKSKIALLLMALLMPLGLSIFMVYLFWLCGDALAFIHIQKAWGRTIQWPWIVLYEGLTGSPLFIYWALISVLSLAIAVYFLFHRTVELGLFLAMSTLIPLSTGLLSMPRYIFWQAPFLLFLAITVSKKSYLWKIAIALSILGMSYLYYFWPTGSNWVI